MTSVKSMATSLPTVMFAITCGPTFVERDNNNNGHASFDGRRKSTRSHHTPQDLEAAVAPSGDKRKRPAGAFRQKSDLMLSSRIAPLRIPTTTHVVSSWIIIAVSIRQRPSPYRCATRVRRRRDQRAGMTSANAGRRETAHHNTGRRPFSVTESGKELRQRRGN